MTKKLLLADDSITIQKVIGIIFATEDYQLLVCDNGDEAFDKALDESPDLVIADVSMPGKDGFELCQAIKETPLLAHTSVLLLPGAFDHFDENRAQEVGADGWLTKPFESQALLDKVAQLIEADPVQLAAVKDPELDADEFAVPELGEDMSVVDEVALGLNEVEESAVVTTVEEESMDDIWDAVSFEEEDLQQTEEPSPAVEEPVVAEEPSVTEAGAEAVIEEPPVPSTREGSFEFADEQPFVANFAADEPLELNTKADKPLELDAEVDEPLELDTEVDEPLELAEDSIVVAENLLTGDDFTEELPVVEPLGDDLLAIDDEEILDLAEDDILDSEPLEDATHAVELVTELTDVPVEDLSAAEIVPEETAADDFITAEPVRAEEPEVVAEILAEEPLVGSVSDSESGITVAPKATDDEGFYFDTSGAAEEESFVESVASVAAGVAVVAEGAPSIAQVEQQLRELSDDELKEVVAKVAGPIIEKLASEMLEQVVWEVVPDLAESMIREEIRKIRQGAE